MENLISSLKIHEMELIGDEPNKGSKYIALKSKSKSFKAHQAMEYEKYNSNGDCDHGSNVEEMTFLTKRLQYLNKKKKRFSRRVSGG